jgi:hypothetical protein
MLRGISCLSDDFKHLVACSHESVVYHSRVMCLSLCLIMAVALGRCQWRYRIHSIAMAAVMASGQGVGRMQQNGLFVAHRPAGFNVIQRILSVCWTVG